MINNKGMTLIEEIIALAIIAIASLIMLVGFSTAAHIFGDSTQYKNITNQQYAALLENENNDESINITNENANVTIKVNDKVISVKGKQKNASSSKDKQAILSTMEFNNITLSNTMQTIANTNELINTILPLKNNELKTWFEEICKNQEAEVPSGVNYYFSNDSYRAFYYYMFGQTHLKLEQDIIDKCNEIFNQMHPNPHTTAEKKAYIGEKTLYIRPYFCGGLKDNSNNFENYVVLVAAPSSGYNQTDGWNTSLVYNSIDGHWYYKIFSERYTDTNSKINIASFTSKDVNVSDLFKGTVTSINNKNDKNYNFSDQTQWVRID